MKPTFNAPLKFAPIYQTRVWGGRRLETFLGRSLPQAGTPYGESWEISDRPEATSVVVSDSAQGLTLHDLWTEHRSEVFGLALVNHPAQRFPLLMKILDASDDLSIQVHPPASVAAGLGGEPKTEMWYIAHADPGARLYAGLQPGVSRDSFGQALQAGRVADLVQSIEPKKGDALFIPSGRIHAIGAGLLIYEIQQNSDTTYRVFDWNRVGLDGKPRALHLDESLASIDFNDSSPHLQRADAEHVLATCEYFDVRAKRADDEAASPDCHMGVHGEHLTFAVVSGSFSVGATTWSAGDFALVPACLDADQRLVHNTTYDAAWLEIRIPPQAVINATAPRQP